MTKETMIEGPAAAKRVLIYRMGSLGDTLVALPALHLVARAFPRAERRLLTNIPVNVKAPPAAAILEHTGLVDGYFRYTVGTRSVAELAQLWWTLVRWRPDVLVYLGSARGTESARRDERFFRLCGIGHMVGVPVTDDMQQNRWDETEQAFEPEAERLARNIAELGDARLDDAQSWDLHLTDAEKAKAENALCPVGPAPLITVSVGTKRQSKDWGRDNWRELLRRMAILYPGYALALCGAEEEREDSEYAAGGWRESAGAERAVNLCGVLTPRECGAVCARSRIFLGHDSGPMHLAASVQTPCVAVFSAINRPRVWFPYGNRHRVLYHKVDCWGCKLEVCIEQAKKCIYSIGVEEVLEQVRAILPAIGQTSQERVCP